MGAATILAGIGLGLQVLGGIQSSNAASSAASFNQQLAQQNAAAIRALANYNNLVFEQEIGSLEQSIALEKSMYQRTVDRVVSSQRAGYAGAGVDAYSGSSWDVADAINKEAQIQVALLDFAGDKQLSRLESARRLSGYEAEVNAWRTSMGGAANYASGQYAAQAQSFSALAGGLIGAGSIYQASK